MGIIKSFRKVLSQEKKIFNYSAPKNTYIGPPTVGFFFFYVKTNAKNKLQKNQLCCVIFWKFFTFFKILIGTIYSVL